MSLMEKCPVCNGTGLDRNISKESVALCYDRYGEFKGIPDYIKCHECNGKKYVLTCDGKELIKFLNIFYPKTHTHDELIRFDSHEI